MSTDLTVEPIAPISMPISILAQAELARAQTVAARQDVARQDLATELALWQSVMASTALNTIDNTDTLAADALAADTLAPLSAPTTFTDTILDPLTQAFMFRVVDVQSGNVVSEVPVGTPAQLVAYNQAVARLIAAGSTPAEARAIAAVDVQV